MTGNHRFRMADRFFHARFCTLLLTVFFAETVGAATIHGVVSDAAGNPVANAAVSLENSTMKTVSAVDGSFSLMFGVTGIRHPATESGCSGYVNGSRCVPVDGSGTAAVLVYTLSGRLVAAEERTWGPGSHSLRINSPGTGMFIYDIRRSSRGRDTHSTAPAAHISAAVPVPSGGVLLVDHDGFIPWRRAIGAADTAAAIMVTLVVCADSVTDGDGNVYKAVQIGGSVWTVENYRSTKYRNGTAIRWEPSFHTWGMWTEGQYCYYENASDPGIRKKYGALYNWYAVANPAGLAPQGWHVPSDSEWQALERSVIDEKGTVKALAAQTDWIASADTGAIGNDLSGNNTAGFSALGGGYRMGTSALFNGLNSVGYWWSSTKKDSAAAYMHYLVSDRALPGHDAEAFNYGSAVRLVRDAQP
jgi:uncharacterized protein (TIGR02145 family)